MKERGNMKGKGKENSAFESLDGTAKRVLVEHNLPCLFSYRQAFILGYNERKKRDYQAIYSGRSALGG